MEDERESRVLWWVRVIVKLVHSGVDGLLLCGVEIVRMELSEG